MNNIDVITECGLTKPITRLELSDKVTIVQAVALHTCFKAELTQFRDGLSALGVLEAIQAHSSLLRSYYCMNNTSELTSGQYRKLIIVPVTDLFHLFADDIRNLFTVLKYSVKGSNDRIKEEASYMFFIDYMDDCEGGEFIGGSCMFTVNYFGALRADHAHF